MVRDRVFITMVSVSLLFHLSMVTLFSIYVYVPVSRPTYAQLAINYLEPVRSAVGSMELTLRAPDLSNPPPPVQAESAIPEAERLTLDLPLISPPTLDIPQLEHAEIIASKATVQSAFREEQGDLWARTIDRFERLEDRARALMSIPSVFPEEETQRQVTTIDQPNASLEVYVEWNLEPRDRELEPGAPLDVLQKVNVRDLNQPILLTFRVNPAGEVLYVFADPGAGGLEQEIAAALNTFHFAPLDDLRGPNQIGTLVIKPRGDR
ncbi:MAG: hypothetical protein IT367_16050 [Candidatus Hydrogenedentes bacterium]|nr:hypothetical protein [Candidatus Hydrogenedentota bacterium]